MKELVVIWVFAAACAYFWDHVGDVRVGSDKPFTGSVYVADEEVFNR